MATKKILYVSGSLGLGHITRDLAIAGELRKLNPEIEISWLAAHPANRVIEESGERLVPEARSYANDNVPAEGSARGTQLNLVKYLSKARKEWARNVEVFRNVISRERFDLVIGDETYEIVIAQNRDPGLKKSPFVIIYDFIGLDAMTPSPLEKIEVYMWNRIWSGTHREGQRPSYDLCLFVGEEEDVPDRKFGLRLPNRRDWARARCQFVGYIIPFKPEEYANRAEVRKRLGYGGEPLVVCSIGGTSVGKELLILCGRAFPNIKEAIPDLRLVLVCGPRLPVNSIAVPPGVEVKGFVPNLYEHFAACDLAIIQGGATSTLELTALRRPFLYFPLEKHFEQAYVSARLARHQAGIRMSYSQTTPRSLAERVISSLGREVSYPAIPFDGARTSAHLISGLL